MRYLARKAGSLYGNTPFESAQIDQWLDYLYDEIEHLMYAMIGQIMGWNPPKRTLFSLARNGMSRVMRVLDEHLQGKEYFAGKDLSIADLGIAVMLSLPFKLLFDQKYRQNYPNVTGWYRNISALPAF